MQISYCKLLSKQQLKLLEYFVLEVTIRFPANLLEIQPNRATLFYRKLRTVIVFYLDIYALKYLVVL